MHNIENMVWEPFKPVLNKCHEFIDKFYLQLKILGKLEKNYNQILARQAIQAKKIAILAVNTMH